MKQQQGAALVIVLALLTGAMMIGVSSMNSALIDERLAGNYRASVEAQMNAEQQAALLANDFVEGSSGVFCSEKKEVSIDERRSWVTSDDFKARFDVCFSKSDLATVYIVEGFVGEPDNPVVSSFIVVGKLRGDGLDDIFSDLKPYEGKSVVAGEGEESCGKKDRDSVESCEVVGKGNVPRPDAAIDSFIANYESGNIPKEEVVERCDGNFTRTVNMKYVLCREAEFTGSLENLDGMTVIVAGKENYNNGEIKYEGGDVRNANIKNNIKINFIARGDILIKGFGNNILTGNLWSGRDVRFDGRSNVVGGIAAVDEVDFDGKANVSEGGGSGPRLVWY
ncbi:pilus assembly PilX N-terminal domain-containing protein [Halomonas sp. Bachu 37]|uniref:pilus assembly PilX family protein n=1 Tax=Halomonas kashgarensis TaxID=3084920 RepID=UPI0032178C80